MHCGSGVPFRSGSTFAHVCALETARGRLCRRATVRNSQAGRNGASDDGTRPASSAGMTLVAGSRSPSYVVGVGASAGGLDALERFFAKVPVDSGMAFVVVQHLSPDFKSLMDELLARHTKLPIQLVE